MRPLIAFMLLLAATTATRRSGFTIQSPAELKELVEKKHPDGIPYSVANYGDIPFGKEMSGTVVFGSILQNCVYEPLSQKSANKANKIVLSNRGDCTFTQKSLNSQKQNAKLALIADNVDNENPGHIVLADDGRGPQVHIPTIFIEKQLGDLIVQYSLEKKKQVNLFIKFQTHKRMKADVTLWLNSFDRKSYFLVRQLQPYFDRIKDSITLRLKHITYRCQNCLQTDCYMNNRYCANVGFQGYIINEFGRTILNLQLKEEFILQQTTDEDNFYDKWWKYMERFDDVCSDHYSLEECSDDVVRKVGLDPSKLDALVKGSFKELTIDNETVLDNSRLQKNEEERIKSGIVYEPAIMVNNLQYRGNLEADEIFQLTCNSLINPPQGCQLKDPPGHSMLKFIIIAVVIFAAFMAFLLGCYRRMVRRQATKNINKEVNDLVNEYITMYETDKFNQDSKKPAKI